MTVTLKNTSAMVVIDTMGAELKSMTDIFGVDYIWCADPAYWEKSSPVLFPVVGGLKNNTTIIEGKEYQIPRHGFAKDYEFDITYQDDCKAMFSLTTKPEMLAMYPFQFNLQIIYTLVQGELHIKYHITNLDDRIMPYFFGAHPGFNCPLNGIGSFEEYVIQFSQNEVANCPNVCEETGLIDPARRTKLLDNQDRFTLSYDHFDVDALIFDEIKSDKVSLYHKKTGRGVELEFHGFNFLGIWTPAKKQAPFLCLEPWAGIGEYSDEDGNFTHKRGLKMLSPAEKHSYALMIRPL